MVRRRARIWWLPVLLGMVLSTGLLVQASATMAAGPGTFIVVGPSHYRDPACGTGNALFNVRTFQDTNYNGRRVDLCSQWSDFCNLPFGDQSSSAILCRSTGVDVPTLNDVISSVKVMAVHGGALCSVRLHEHKDFGGASWTVWDPVDQPDLHPWPGDHLSSVRRVCT